MAEWHLRLAMRSGQIRFRLKLRATSAPGQRERPAVAAQIQTAQHMDKGPKPAPFQLLNASSARRPLPEVYFSRVDRTLRMEKLELIRSTPGREERISLCIRSKAPALSTSTRSM